MKVVIELIGNESRESLLATSNYLRELAGEAVPEVTEAKVYGPDDETTANAKTDLDKLADAVVEATKVREESAPVKTVAEHVEEERAKTRAKRAVKPAPVEEVVAPVEEVVAPVEEPAPAPKAPAAPVEKSAKTETEHTIDECKQWAMKALNAKKRPLVQEAFEQVGATSFPTLKESMFAEFIEYISTRL
jgi:hypothetical protein